jgi:PAS domain-containing protein
VVVTDGAGIIQSASGREKLLRRPPSALLGLRLRDVLGKKAYAPFGELFRRAMAAREPAADEFPCILGEGLVPVLHTVVIPVADENGTPSRWVWVARDVTEPREDERRLRQKEALLAQAEQIANMGSWERNLETGELHWSEHRYRMLGLQPNRPPATVETLRQMIHPDDRERVKQLHGRFHIRSAPGRGTTVLADLPLSPDQDADSWIVPGPEPAGSSVEM